MLMNTLTRGDSCHTGKSNVHANNVHEYSFPLSQYLQLWWLIRAMENPVA